MPSLGAVLGFAGVAVQAAQAFSAGRANAATSADQAVRIAEKTRLEVERARRAARRAKGAQRAGFARAGVRGDAGSALDVIADSAAQAELDVRLIEAGGTVAESLARSEAAQARRRGVGVAGGGLLAGLGDLLEEF